MDWEAFFGQDNVESMRWDHLSLPGSPARQALQPFIDLVENGVPLAALPRVRQGGEGRIAWYVGWRHESDTRFVQDLIRAFIGRTFGDMKAPLHRLAPMDASEEAFALEFGGRAIRLEVAQERECRLAVREQFLILAGLLQNRPRRLTQRIRPVGRMLRDLELAFQAGNEVAVRDEIKELRSGKHLDDANLAFLEFRYLDLRGDWSGILNHEALGSLLNFRSLPWRVRGALLRAFYFVHLAGPVERGDLEQACTLLEAHLPAFHVAFQSKMHLQGIEPAICFLLAGLVRGENHPEGQEGLLNDLEISGNAAFANKLRDRFRKHSTPWPAPELPPTANSLDAARAALLGYDLDRAAEFALAAEVSMDRARLLLQLARLLDEPALARRAVEACDQLGKASLQELMEVDWCRTLYASLQQSLGGVAEAASGEPGVQVIDSWEAWFQRLSENVPWSGAGSMASHGILEWDTGQVASNPSAVEGIVAILESRLPDWAQEELRNSVAFLLDAFLLDPPDLRLARIVGTLFELVATDDFPTANTTQALLRMAHCRILADSRCYKECIHFCTEAISEVLAPSTIHLVADALEMMISLPCSDEELRKASALRLLGLASRWWNRLDPAERLLLRSLAVDLDLGPVLAEETADGTDQDEPEANWGQSLQKMSVGFYSLNSSAMVRTVEVLRQLVPGIHAKIFCEYVGSPTLKEAARTADLFVVATRAAKHAATLFITQHRQGKPILFAGGKGSSSMLAAIKRWALESH